jgi:hypothetical protein
LRSSAGIQSCGIDMKSGIFNCSKYSQSVNLNLPSLVRIVPVVIFFFIVSSFYKTALKVVCLK